MKLLPLLKRLVYVPRQFLRRILSPASKPAHVDHVARPHASIYNLSVEGIDGKKIPFSQFKGKKMLLVNTASECGFTPQYKPLQQLHEQYGDRLVVIGFPSNDFGEQEPGDESEIASFCERNYGVTFPLTKKIDVIGEHQHPVFQWLSRKELNGWNDKAPNWNFCKYLVDENGSLLAIFSKKVEPMSVDITSMI